MEKISHILFFVCLFVCIFLTVALCPFLPGFAMAPHIFHLFIHLSTGNKEDNKWREHWMKTKDAKSTLEAMPRHKRTSAENQLLNGLASVKKADPFQALLFVSVPGGRLVLQKPYI